ncbi:hypothetical protein [Vibrio phage vB_pir03]|nr:hypothetical protein [Vibrio phage vB_pir03]
MNSTMSLYILTKFLFCLLLLKDLVRNPVS